MNWEKKGLIYRPLFDKSWRDNSALTPTAIKLNESVIRVYCGMRDKGGVSRIGYIDVDSEFPKRIVNISKNPVLDIGEKGMFDDNGVILGDLIMVKNLWYMYYVGFQKVNNVKFLAYSGLAVSKDNGDSFVRRQKTPVLDRTNEALYIRALHTIIYDEGKFKVWYATGSSWRKINGVDYPEYDINYIESIDGISFPISGKKCIVHDKKNGEYRIGRPRVYKTKENYIMNFTYGTIDGRYQVGQAFSSDGLNWDRDDLNWTLLPSNKKKDWDSKHLCYPHVFNFNNKLYAFYNGNNMGINGFGYAELKDYP